MASQTINSENIANVYLFYGPEDFKKRNYKEKLKKLIAGEGSINYAAYEGKSINFSAVYDSVVTLPFFAEKKLVIVENSGIFKAARKKADKEDAETGSDSEIQEESSGKNDAMIDKILAALPPSTCLAFFESEINKTKKSYKTIAKNGQVVECTADTPETVIKWLAKGFAQAKKNIRKSTAELIVARVGTSYDRLKLEYEKIIAYSGDSSEITDEMVTAVTGEDIESKIFDMLTAMTSKNKNEVMKRYYELLANKEHPLYILAMIRGQFRTILQTKEMADKGLRDSDIASMLKKRDFVITKARRCANAYSARSLEDIMDKICQVDMDIKSGDLDEQIGVEMMIMELSS